MPINKQNTTIRDVAHAAGVSKSTVSRVLNNKGYIAPETIERVRQAIDELKYIPQATARSLAKQRTNTLGFAINDLSTLAIASMLSGIDAVTHREGYNLLIAAMSHYSPDATPPLGPHSVDGLIVYADALSDKLIGQFYNSDFPIIFMHRHPPEGSPYPTVNIENTQSTIELIKHLITVHDYRRIAFLQGPATQSDSQERESGYRQALSTYDIDPDPALIARAGFDEQRAYDIVSAWIESDRQIDAVFAADDKSAVGCIQAIQDMGQQVPDDIAVVGFDDDHRAAYINPPLTTVRVPTEKLGQAAAEQLMQLLKEGHAESIVLPTEVIIRQSCGCA